MASLPARRPLSDLVADVILLVAATGQVIAGNALAAHVLGREPGGMALGDVFGHAAEDGVRRALREASRGVADLEAPLATTGGPTGYLWLLSPGPDDTIAMCGREIDRIYGLDLIQRLSEGILDRQSRLEVASSINRALARTLDIDKIDQVVASQARGLVPADFLQIAVAATAIELCDVKVLTADAESVFVAESRPWAGLSAERSFRERRPRVHLDATAIGAPLTQLGAHSAMHTPIILDDQVLGVLTFAAREPAAYESQDALAVEAVVGQYAIALANARVVRGLRETNRIKQEVIEIASHEFNTPLTVIKGFASLLSEGLDVLSPQQATEAIRMIDVEAERLRRLVDELLTVSRIDAGRIDLYLSDVDLALLVRDSCKSLEIAYPGRVIAVETPCNAKIRQDPNKIARCLSNLLSNALKFSPKDSAVEVTLGQEEASWVVSVFNVDQGLTEAEMAQLFEKFKRLERHKNHSEGTGLGLYMARRLAQRLGGEVRVRSQPGRGTTFMLRVPNLSEHELTVIAAGEPTSAP